MPKWFRRGEGDETATVPRAWRKALDTSLAGLDRGHPHLPAHLRDYILTGSHGSALGAVAQCTDAPLVLFISGPWAAGGAGEHHRQIYADLHTVPAEVTLRWARVLEAVSAANPWMLGLDPVAGGHWAEALVIHMANVYGVSPRSQHRLPLSHTTLETVIEAAGGSASDLLEAAFREATSTHSYSHGRVRDALARMEGYSEAVMRRAEALRPIVAAPDGKGRLVVIAMLARLDDAALGLFAGEIADYATSTSSQVRKSAATLADRCGQAIAEPLRSLAQEAKPEQRGHAFRLLWSRAADAEARAWAQEHAAADRAPSVQALAQEWANGLAGPEPEVLTQEPPRPDVSWRVPVTPEVRAALEALWRDANRAIEKANAQRSVMAERWTAEHGTAPSWKYLTDPLSTKHLDLLVRALEADAPTKPPQGESPVGWDLLADAIERHAASPALSPAATVTLLAHLHVLLDHRQALSPVAAAAFNAQHGAIGHPTLLELSTMLDDLGLDGGRAVFHRYAASWGDTLAADWPDDDVAPFVTRHLELVVGALTSSERDYAVTDDAPYRALGTLRVLPRSVTDTLFSLALGSRKAERRPAQEALARMPEREARIITALADGKGEVRAEAARWLGRLRHEAAIPALETAVAKEKHDVAKGAMLDALLALGQPVEKYLDRDALTAQASAALAKGLPKELAWFPWAALPGVRWADSGDPVATTTLQWLIAQAVKSKSPEPNAILRKYCAMFDPRDRERLGQFLLEAWMAEDLRPIDVEEAERRASERAQWTHQSHTSHPEYYQDAPQFGMSFEELTAAYLPAFLREPAASATPSKGVLAVAAACAGEGAAAPVARYLMEWYGMRASQGKALIAMLAWIEHPSATQLMLAVGSRFRTKSFQDEATRQAEALAERKGWTVSELADRTIPTAGLDEAGVLELSYGDRAFSAVLLPDLSLELRSPEGKKISSLPSPRKSDDEDRAKEAKKSLTAARKELKSVVQLQTERLYEALCTGRTWAAEDWDRYLGHHPVVRHLTQRLVWAAVTEGGPPLVFRPLDDGTLTDADDAEVSLPDGAQVQVAHDSNLDDRAVARWQEHLEDYEVTPLFQQFGKGTYELPANRGPEREIADFRGHLVEAFSLRGRAGKLGYTRGGTEDGGWFYTYEKRFPTLGMSSVIEFSGNGLPEQNRTVALTCLRFQRHAASGGAPATLRLHDVPAVLLSEAYNDLRLIASEGSGHDPEWEKKVEF